MSYANTEIDYQAVNTAFSSQSSHFDEEDISNGILQEWRQRIYQHVDSLINPASHLLELNAGTGIDSVRFVSKGHYAHATDLSDGMIRELNKKIGTLSLQGKMTSQQISYDRLDRVEGQFDYVFSNFGGLNCIPCLSDVTCHLSTLLRPGAIVTFVIMPKFCPWELLWVLKGETKQAFRRWNKNGVMAHLEGSYFKTYYHTFSKIKEAFGPEFTVVKAEGLGIVSPPPAALSFVRNFPTTTRILNSIDRAIAGWLLFNRWGDHIIVSYRYTGSKN